MNILILGNGGREHALALKVKESPRCSTLFISPGNGGTTGLGKNFTFETKNELIDICKSLQIDLIIVGPEKYLVDGTVDLLKSSGFVVFGPEKVAAQIESNKLFAKNLMVKAGVPTASFAEFSIASSKEDIYNFLRKHKYPLVVKANGLAAGKGVAICKNMYEALDAILLNFDEKVFGEAGNQIVIEDFLDGEEASLFAICDGNDFFCLPAAQDHKRIGDYDTGKNTGGMGAFAPALLITPELQEEIERTIVKPILVEMKKQGFPFVGCLFCGLMITKDGPKVIEFNARFGDPETQAVLGILDGDFLQLLYSAAIGKIDKSRVKYNGGASVCVVTASKGYPDSYATNFEIRGLDTVDANVVKVFHAGTAKKEDSIVTSGGRVLGVTSFVPNQDFEEAIKVAYAAVRKIYYDNIYFRTDIAKRALKSTKLS